MARRRRSLDETDLETKTVSADLLVFALADEEKNDIPTLAMQQEEIIKVIYLEPTEGRAIEIRDIDLNGLPPWFFFVLTSVILLTLAFCVTIYKRRYAGKDVNLYSKLNVFHK